MMYRELFWVHKDFFSEAVGFSVFSAPHLLWLAGLAVLITGYTVCYCRSGETGRDNLRKMTALFLVLIEIFKMCVMALTNAPIRQHLPLELCSLSEYTILLDAFWSRSRLPKQMMAFAFLPAAIMALVFPVPGPCRNRRVCDRALCCGRDPSQIHGALGIPARDRNPDRAGLLP